MNSLFYNKKNKEQMTQITQTTPTDLPFMRASVDQILQYELANYAADGCGICKTYGADVWWPNKYSSAIHSNCWKLVESNARSISDYLDVNTDYNERNKHHRAIVTNIQNTIEENYQASTMKDFIETFGGVEMQEIINSVLNTYVVASYN